jgi:hypothetical protein
MSKNVDNTIETLSVNIVNVYLYCKGTSESLSVNIVNMYLYCKDTSESLC